MTFSGSVQSGRARVDVTGLHLYANRSVKELALQNSVDETLCIR